MITGENAGLECKTASQLSKTSYENGDIPKSYYAQCQHYMISGQMVRDGANYDKKVRAGIASGRRRTKKEQCSNNDPTLPGDTATEDGYEYDTDNENDTDTGVKKQSSRFQKPTVEEVAAFLAEKGYHFQADAFVDYYESNGWMVGKNHMN